jgi:type IV pilus assembly protein PilF
MNTTWTQWIRTSVLLAVVAASSACTIVTTTAKRTTDDQDASTFNAKLGAQYLQRGNLELANEKLLKALEQDANNPLAHITMARLQFSIDKNEVARKHYKRAVALEPDNADNRNAYGIFLCSTGDVAGAELEFKQAAENPFYGTPEFALDNAGVCMLEVGRLEDAETYLIKALQRNPQFGNAYLHLAELRFRERRLTIAESYLSRHHDTSPISSASLWLGVQIHRDRGNRSTADSFAKRLLNEFPNSQEAGAYLAQAN